MPVKTKTNVQESHAVTEVVTPTKKKRPGVRTFGVAMLFILAIAIFIKQTVFTIEVKGRSMRPTFENGERLLATKAYWMVGPITRNDVIVIKGATPGEFLIKRVNRLGGEKVDFLNAPDSWRIEQGEYFVPEGHVYVLGDNSPESEDSRSYGPVPLSDIIGKVIVLK
jgi:signal peptidase I